MAYSMGHENHVAQGTRFDATKIAVGKYFSTTIWEFRMKCKLCYHEWVIQTDPENRTFKCVQGCRRKIKEFDATSAGTMDFNTAQQREQMAEDAFFKLEHLEDEKRKSLALQKANDALESLQNHRKDDYALNSSLRNRLRGKKREHQKQVEEGKKLGLSKASVAGSWMDDLPLLPETEEDGRLASEVVFSESLASKTNKKAAFRESYKRKRLDVATGSIFNSTDPEKDRKMVSLKKQRQLGIDHRNFVMPSDTSIIAGAGRLQSFQNFGSGSSTHVCIKKKRMKLKQTKSSSPPSKSKQPSLSLVAYDTNSESNSD